MVNHLVYWQRRVNQYKLFLSKVLKYRLNTLVWHCFFYYNKGHVVQFSMHNRWFVIIRDMRCLLSGMAGARNLKNLIVRWINLRNVTVSHI